MGKTYDIPEITVVLSGGLVQDVNIPKGTNVKVRVKDYDVSEILTEEEIKQTPKDPDGTLYEEQIWNQEDQS
jgi:hypothetical protein